MNTRAWLRIEALSLATCGLMLACGDDAKTTKDTTTGTDAATDVGTDAATDSGTATDAGTDAATDAATDTGTATDAATEIADDTSVPTDAATEVDDDTSVATDAEVADDVTAPTVLAVFHDDYGTDLSFKPFGGSTNDVTIDTVEKHSGTASLKIAVPAAGYTGGAIAATAAQDLSGYDAVTFWAKASEAHDLNVVGLANDAVTAPYQIEWNAVGLTTAWKRYVVPLPDPSLLDAELGLFHFAEGAEAAPYTIWIDDIQYENLAAGVLGTAAPAIATETVSREIGGTTSINGASVTIAVDGVNQTLAVARPTFSYTSSNTAVATVDDLGTVLAKGVGTAEITADLAGVAAAGKLTFQVTDALLPSTAAPTPTVAADKVKSLFSNAYTNATVDTWSAVWDSADVADVQVAGNDTKKYTALNFAGVEFTSAVLDVTTMTHFHIDVWSPDGAEFKVKLVDFGANGTFQGAPNDDTEHELVFNASTTPAFTSKQWVSLDLPLSSFTNLTGRAHMAQVVLSSTNATAYVDNVYFYQGAAVANAPTTAAPTPTAASADVISLFSNAYTNGTVDTWSAPWDSADVTDVQVAGNDTKKYTALVFAGIEFTSSVVNATTMTHFHIDVWSPDGTVFKVKLVDFGANGVFQGAPNDDTEHELVFDGTTTPAFTTGQWVSLDLPLSSFTGLASRAHLAQLIIVSSNATAFVDNIYFHK